MTSSQVHKRTIRSFVRRAGRLTPSQQRALLDLMPHYGLTFTNRPLDLATAFGRRAPLVLEIGFGDGESMVQQVIANPDDDWLGIEVHEPGVGHCLLEAHASNISNLRIVVHDAVEVLSLGLENQTLSRVNLYFPDPWPKKRHHKRRIVQAPFLRLVADRLQTGGSLHIATDWANYAEHIDDIVSRSEHFICSEFRQHRGDAPLDRPRTKFEQRGLKKGHQIYDWRFTKVSS